MMKHVNQDLELAIQDMEDRASRLRDLIEQEEIMSEEYRRMSEESREHLLGARDQVASFLDEVRTSLAELERLRTTACLKAMTASSSSSTTSQVEEVDYEAMLDALEEDLKVVHTVPLVQVKDALDRWVAAIKKEVQMLFQTGTLRRVTHGEIKELEQSGKVMMAPAKCVFTLKPPSISGRRARRKCRIVICGNYVPAGSSDISLYASGASTDALRVALVLSSLNNWLGAVSDIASAFLLAPWPKDLPRYAIRPPKVVRDSGEATDSEYWVIDRALYGLRESPAIWGSFRSKRLGEARISFNGVILRFVATISDPELWLVQEECTKELYGLLVTYVDDLLYFGKRDLIEALHRFVLEEWPASDLEWINEDLAVRYLGVEIWKGKNGGFLISQQAYVEELLRTHEMQDVHPTQLPAPREWIEATELQEESEEFEEGDLRQAQRCVGEAL